MLLDTKSPSARVYVIKRSINSCSFGNAKREQRYFDEVCLAMNYKPTKREKSLDHKKKVPKTILINPSWQKTLKRSSYRMDCCNVWDTCMKYYSSRAVAIVQTKQALSYLKQFCPTQKFSPLKNFAWKAWKKIEIITILVCSNKNGSLTKSLILFAAAISPLHPKAGKHFCQFLPYQTKVLRLI